METLHNGALDRAKKEAKRLYSLGKKAHGHLQIGSLSDAQAVVAALKNCSNWHELEERSKRSLESPPMTASPLAQAMAAHASGTPSPVLLNKSGIACRGAQGAVVRLPLLGSDPDFSTKIQWIKQSAGGESTPLLAAALRQAKAEGDDREFFLISAKNTLADVFKELGGAGEVDWIQRDADGMFPAINPMETHPGERHMRPSSRTALCILLVELSGRGSTLIGAHGALIQAIDLAYRKKSDDEEPNPYEPGAHMEVDQALDLIDPTQKPATWWIARDILEISGHARLAQKAQSMSVPTLMDVMAALPLLDHVYGSVHVNGHKLLGALVEGLSSMQRFAPDLFRASHWWPRADLRGLGFNISDGNMRSGEASFRYLWARVVARRCLSSLGGMSGSENWMNMDVGTGEGAKQRRRELARQFKAGKKQGSATIIDGLDDFCLTPNAHESLLKDAQDARIHGHSLSFSGRCPPPWVDLASLAVDFIKSVDGLHGSIIYAAHASAGRVSGHCHYDIGLWDIWLGSGRSCDRELALAARRSKYPDASMLLVGQAYPGGTWEPNAEQAAGDLPWGALEPHEAAAIADHEIARLSSNPS